MNADAVLALLLILAGVALVVRVVCCPARPQHDEPLLRPGARMHLFVGGKWVPVLRLDERGRWVPITEGEERRATDGNA